MAYRTLGTDRIMEVAAAPGTGAVTLGGAAAGFRSFASVLAVGDTCAYFIEAADTTGVASGTWERGFGTLTAATTFARTTVMETSGAPGTPVNFTANVRIGIAPMSETVMHHPTPGGRLTVSATSPTADGTTTGGLLYYLPFVHDKVPVFNGGGIQLLTIPPAGVSLDISGTVGGTGYDVFAFGTSAGALQLLSTAWTNLTTRATNLAYLNGFLCQSTSQNYRYLGSFAAHANGTTIDSPNTGSTGQRAPRLVWNMYNRIAKPFYMIDTTGTWSPSGSWRVIRGLAAPNGCVELFRGLDEEAVVAVGTLACQCTQNATAYCAIGLDGVSIPQPMGYGQLANSNPGIYQAPIVVPYAGLPGVGYHTLVLLDNGNASAVIGWNMGTCGIIGNTRG